MLLELLGKLLHLLELDVLVGGQIKAEHGMARRVTREGWRMIGLLLRGREPMVESLEWGRGLGALRKGED